MKLIYKTILALGFAVTVFLPFRANAQNETVKTGEEAGTVFRSVYGEIGGASSLIGASYDQRFRPGSRWGFRAGLAYAAPIHWTQLFFYRGGESLLTVPLAANVLVTSGAHSFEAGLGFTPGLSFSHGEGRYRVVYDADGVATGEWYDPGNTHCDFYSDVFVDLGYRYMHRKGFMFRAGISPALCISDGFDVEQFMLRPYVSFGYTFGK